MSQKLTVFVLALGLLSGGRVVLAYDDETTHPALTDEIVDYYNLVFPDNTITPEQKEWIILGSALEDTPPRWINHFYDPVYGVGWTGEKTGMFNSVTVQFLSKIGLSAADPVSLVRWVNDYHLQERYSPYGGNRTWRRALEYYAEGDLKEAYLTLGHVLHLLEDASVPDHTRNDTHAHALGGVTGDPGSPYEDYARNYTRSTLNIASGVYQESAAVIQKHKIEDYLVSLAEYSNKYFFSKDTIDDSKYNMPRITRKDESFGYSLDEKQTEFPLVRVKSDKKDGVILEKFSLDSKDEKEILEAYFSRLSKQALLHGAGVLDLFHKEAADAVVNAQFPTRLVTIDPNFSRRLNLPSFSLFGLGSRLWQSANSALSSVAATTQNLYNSLGANISLLGEKPNEFKPVVVGLNNATADPETNLPSNKVIPAVTLSDQQITNGELTANPTAETIDEPISANEESPQITTAEITETDPDPVLPALGGRGNGPNISSGGVAAVTAPFAAAEPQASAAAPEADASAGNPVPDYVVISEVQAAGESAGDEFIELYNPTGEDWDLSGWSIQYLSGQADSLDNAAKKNFEAGSAIASKGFFLIGRKLNNSGEDGYLGAKTPDLLHRSFALSGADDGATMFLVRNQEVIDSADDPDVVDRLAYGSGAGLLAETEAALIIPAGQSLERKALVGQNCDSPATSQFSGNGCDSGNNKSDFIAQGSPNPQNTVSLPEPRNSPAPLSWTTQYLKDTATLRFAWQTAADARGATSSVTYGVETNAGESIFSNATGSDYRWRVFEVGRGYDLIFSAADEDGLSASSSARVEIPGFLNNLYFYPDPVAGSSSLNLIELTYLDFPFIPTLTSSTYGLSWQGVVFYLNGVPGSGNNILTTASQHWPDNRNGILKLFYSDCNSGQAKSFSLIFALDGEHCGSGGGLKSSSMPPPTEDLRAIVQTASSTSELNLGATDYLTVAYYDFKQAGGGNQDLELIGTDARKFYFSATPPAQASPTAPPGATVLFDEDSSVLTIQWTASTDPDSADGNIEYAIRYATSSANLAGYENTGQQTSHSFEAVFDNEYKIEIIAQDERGNISDPLALTWNFPAGYAPLPKQTNHSQNIGRAGSGQLIWLNATTTLTGIAMWVGNDGGRYCCAESLLEIRADSGGSFGEVLATSANVRIGRNVDEQENLYGFSPAVTLPPGAYWLVVQNAPAEFSNGSNIWGSAGDSYADGQWSANAGKDAYFRLQRE